MDEELKKEDGGTLQEESGSTLMRDDPDYLIPGHFAEVVGGIVQRVICASQEFIDSGRVGTASNWVKTSYNTHGGQHTKGGTPLRKNYAGIGYTYDVGRDAFIAPRPFASWTLNETTCEWDPPVAYPNDGNVYNWNEPLLEWQLRTF